MTDDEELQRKVLEEAAEAARRAEADAVPGLRPDERKQIAKEGYDSKQVARTIEQREG